MKKSIFSVLFVLCILIAACVQQPSQIEATETLPPPVTPMAEVMTITPEVTATQALDCHPVTLQTSGSLEPIFVEIVHGKLWLRVGDHYSEAVGRVHDLGLIKEYLLAEDTLFLLSEQGIQSFGLSDCANDTLVEFKHRAMSGRLLYEKGEDRLFYAAVDGVTRESIAGYVDLKDSTAHEVFSYLEDDLLTFDMLGLTTDRKGIYLLQHGQDPALGRILIADIEKREITGELAIEGYGEAELSPDGRWLAVNNQVVDTSDPTYPVFYQLNLYDLTAPESGPKVFDYPHAPSELGIGKILWSPDSQKAYFLVVARTRREPNSYSSSISYGLWSLDAASGVVARVSEFHDPNLYTIAINPDGTWIYLRGGGKNAACFVNVITGEVRLLSIPGEEILVGWE